MTSFLHFDRMFIGITIPKGEKNMAKKPLLPIRLLMQFLSVIVCLVLTVSLLATAILLDMKLLTSAGGMQTIITAFMSGSSSSEPSTAVPGNGYIVSLGSSDGLTGNVQIPDDLEIPSDALTNTNILTDYIYDIIQSSTDEEITITKDQVQNFIDESTIKDYTAEKAASYISDAINGEEKTTISVDEIMDLFEENQKLLEEHFDITVTDDMKTELRTQVDRVIEEEDLNGTIRQEINKVMEQPIEGTDYTVKDIMAAIGQITADNVIFSAIGLCLLLIALLMLLNFYKLPKGLSWASTSFLTVGMMLSIPLFIIRSTPELLVQVIPQAAGLSQTVTDLTSIITPVHYGILILGVVMLVLSIVWRILAKAHRVVKVVTGSGKKHKKAKKVKKVPVAEATPVIEEVPAVEETPVEEKAPVVEETPVEEEAPVVEETPIEEETPVVEETPVEEESPIIEETPVEEVPSENQN